MVNILAEREVHKLRKFWKAIKFQNLFYGTMVVAILLYSWIEWLFLLDKSIIKKIFLRLKKSNNFHYKSQQIVTTKKINNFFLILHTADTISFNQEDNLHIIIIPSSKETCEQCHVISEKWKFIFSSHHSLHVWHKIIDYW